MPPLTAALLGAATALVVVALVAVGIVANRRRLAKIAANQPRQVSSPVPELIGELPVGVVIVGPHDDILATNEAARKFGAVRGSRLGFTRLLIQVRQVRQSGNQFDGELEREPVPGQESLQLRCRIAHLDKDLIAVIAFDDAQERRVEAVRRDFVANVSHELKTPIGAISVLAEAVEAAKDDPVAVERFAGRLQRETSRLTELVGQIIDLSRLQAENPIVAKEVIDLRTIIAEAMGRTSAAAQRRRVNIIVARTTETRIMGDRWQLVDAVTNLIQNAINYSDEGARVAISVIDAVDEAGESIVELKVSDNGIGISEEDQKRIFERFYRVDYGRSRSTGGTGLGLSIVRHIALTHGGGIKVWSKLGQGSTFTLRFPALHDGDVLEKEES